MKVKIQTTLGDIVVRLFDETPLHRDNFAKLAKEGYYDGTLFHRVIKDFMIQGGDPDSKNAPAGKHLGMGGPGYTSMLKSRRASTTSAEPWLPHVWVMKPIRNAEAAVRSFTLSGDRNTVQHKSSSWPDRWTCSTFNRCSTRWPCSTVTKSCR